MQTYPIYYRNANGTFKARPAYSAAIVNTARIFLAITGTAFATVLFILLMQCV